MLSVFAERVCCELMEIVVNVYQAFSGQGNRLDGKSKTTMDSPQVQQSHDLKRFVKFAALLGNTRLLTVK